MTYKYPTHCILCKEPLTEVFPATIGGDALRAKERYDTECAKCLYHKFVNSWISKFKVETYKVPARVSMNAITFYWSSYTILCYPENNILEPETRIYKGNYNSDPILTTQFVDWNWEELPEFEKQIKFMLAYS